MKTILIPVELHDLVQPTLETAVSLGKSFGSYMEGFALSPVLSPFLAADAMGATVVYSDIKQDDEIMREARTVFENFMHKHDIPAGPGRREGPSFGWHEAGARGDNFIGSHGRIFDMIVVGRPGTKPGQPRMSALEAALFESGRPILIAPPAGPQNLGENILIAWNGSTETARTIGLAKPLLRRARRIVVLSVEGSGVPGPTGEQVASYIEYNGIPCEARSIDAGGRSTGEAILAEATKLGSDLLIKGAFTQSRLRQMIFGGATRHILAEANLPVFMAH